MKLFENDNKIIKSMTNDILNIIQNTVGSKVYVIDSFLIYCNQVVVQNHINT